MVKRITLKSAELIAAAALVAAGIVAFEGISLWIAMRGRD